MDKTSRRSGQQSEAWNSRVGTWTGQVEQSPAFLQVRQALLDMADPRSGDRCVDLGAGSGFVALRLAPQVASVLAVDIAADMLASLQEQAQQLDISNVTVHTCDMTQLRLAPGSVDLVVSSYALHSLTHQEKRRLLREIHLALTPGGQLVVADMMLGRGLSPRDREIFLDKARRLARRGPAGLWRLARNAVQLGLGIGENRPATPGWWSTALTEAGFSDVRFNDVVAEAGVIAGRKPE